MWSFADIVNENIMLPVMNPISCDHQFKFTGDDVLDSSVLPLIHVSVVFSLPPPELSDQFLLLPFSSVWRLREEQI